MATVNAIKYGMKGDDVSKLQTTLKNAGYNIDVDGSFGPQTLAAVKDYQKANGLTVDGMVGPQTQAALYGGSSTATTTPATTTPAATTPKTTTATTTTTTTPAATTSGSGSKASGAATAGSANISYPDMPTYEKFVADEYGESPTVQAAYAAIEAVNAAKPGAYESKWQGQINDIIDRILNREQFSYDVNEDALYQQYKDQYVQGGKLAMQDTMGQAAAMTGGYGSSYASTAGNQAYQAYLSQLNEVVPELYGMALDKYNAEGQEMYNQYGLLSDAESQDYARYMDGYNQWLAERDYATGRYDTERGFDYGKYIDDRNLDYQTHTDEQDRAWNEYVTGVQNAQWGASFDETVKQNAIGNEQWEKSFGETVKQNEIDNEYRETTRQDAIDSENKKYAREDVLATIAAGGTPNEHQLKIAGWTKATAQAHAAIASGNGDSDEIIDLVKEMPTDEIVDLLETYAAKGNNNAIEVLVDDWYLTGRITEEQRDDYRKKYLKGNSHVITDTTVATPTGGGGGTNLQRAW